MSDRKHHISFEEKNRLITLFIEFNETVTVFCEKHGIPSATFYRWLSVYKKDGACGLDGKKNSKFNSIASDKETETELRKEILRLRIENERLKKNYTVRRRPDGKTEYTRLKAKNTRS